jgi:hypothetical protein
MAAGSRKKFYCLDCGVDTGKIGEFYFIKTELWLKVVGTTKGMLCIGCLEKRMERRLCKTDFTSATINNPRFVPKSQRLMDRLTAR